MIAQISFLDNYIQSLKKQTHTCVDKKTINTTKNLKEIYEKRLRKNLKDFIFRCGYIMIRGGIKIMIGIKNKKLKE